MTDSSTTPCLWQAGNGISREAYPPLTEDLACDVAIVGGGFTGLWTALYLRQAAPELSIRVLEAAHCGHGASGRNGGWLMASLEGLHQFADTDSRLPAELLTLIRGLIPEAFKQIERHSLQCDVSHGGALFSAARYSQQIHRAKSMLREQQRFGFTEDDYRWLDAREASSRVNAAGTGGGIYTPLVATLNPWKLIRELARAASGLGVAIHEQTPVNSISNDSTGARVLRTQRGSVSADWIVLATEGYSEGNNPLHNYILPVQSGMVATEPLSEAQWQTLGFHQREAFCDFSRASTYLQRSADNRLVVGARGSYLWGRKCQHTLDALKKETAKRQSLARQLFPQLGAVEFTHAWGGTLGIPRRFAPHVTLDRNRGLATAGGYIGEGVGASLLFGKTLAHLLLNKASELTQMPWVRAAPLEDALRRWEPEPLPWLGFNATMLAFDLEERLK